MHKTNYWKYSLLFILSVVVLSCSEDDPTIDLKKPIISFPSEIAEYRVKIGNGIIIEPTISNAINPFYSWKLNGRIISTEANLAFKGEYLDEHFITFRVDAENGTVEKQVKIAVVDRLTPEVNMPKTMIAFLDKEVELVPDIAYTDETTIYEWRLEGKLVGNKPTYTYKEISRGAYALSLKVTNGDGYTVVNTTVTAVPEIEPALFFDAGRYFVPSDMATRRMSVPLGKTLALAPVTILFTDNASYTWEVDGATVGETSHIFQFQPTEEKEYLITVTATEGGKTATTQVKIACVAPEGTYYRATTDKSKAKAVTCFEFIPAPGQFVNYQEGSTAEQARLAIQNSLDNDGYTGSSWIASLGAFGGYFITGFDHSVKNEEGPDLLIAGNAFANWSEPGIVWVMQDENGNGLPDDTWYELRGSETGNPETTQRYALSYYRPTGDHGDVLWIDNQGNSGSIDNNGYHNQKSYFPMFIQDEYYTLTGTCLKTTFTVGGIEVNPGFDWGYVDNLNSREGFDISDAIGQDGKPVNLQYIDFVKVHTGQLGKGAAVGEISTETGAPVDYHIYKLQNN